MKVKIKKLHENAIIPSYANPADAGMDLTAVSREIDYPNQYITYGTGLSVEIPEGYAGLLFPRSSVYKTGMTLANSVGVVDSGYRGEVMLKYHFFDRKTYKPYDIMERVGQILIVPYPKIEFELAEELSSTDRGDGGFGSTGK